MLFHVCIYIHTYVNVYVYIPYFPNSTTQGAKNSKEKKDKNLIFWSKNAMQRDYLQS